MKMLWKSVFVIVCLTAVCLLVSGCNIFRCQDIKKYENVKQIFPPASDRTAWANAMQKTHNKKLKAEIMKRAEKLLKEPVPDISATLFMEYVRNGNRTRYQAPYYRRRINVAILAFAESIEYKGRYIDKIMDYIWEIMSEPTWILPAHCYLKDDPFPELPLPKENVDLFNSETGLTLALVMNLLEKEITAVSPNFVKMIRKNIISRIVEPLEDGQEHFWFKGLNNWTPWCCSNSIGAAVWALKNDPERKAKLINTLHTAIKNYIRLYPEDGFCFEGPAYWGASPAMMLNFLEQLGEWPDDPKIRLIAEYITDVRMSPERTLNFGDCPSKMNYPPWVIYRFGERLQSDIMKAMAAENMQKINNKNIPSQMINALARIFWLPEKIEVKKFAARPVSFYPHTQFFIMRQNGAAVGAKRGHAWSHHHMDIGHFMLFFKDEPIIIDRGKTEYTKDTFTDKRFLNDILNGEGHNVLHFNGKGQFTEAPAAPGAMTVTEDKDFIKCRMDLTTSYIPEAKVRSYVRELVYDRKKSTLSVFDNWELDTDKNEVYANFFTPQKVTRKDGRLFIGDVPLSAENCEITVEKVKNVDSEQLRNWGKWLNKIQIRKKSAKKGNWHLLFDLK